MRDLDEIRSGAANGLNAAMRDLREASRTLAHDDPQGALGLARTVVLLSAIVRRAPVVMTPGLRPAADTSASWLLAAGRLHEALADAYGDTVGLWYVALDAKRISVPDEARVLPSDEFLFRHAPVDGNAWGPLAVAHIEALALWDNTPARERRAAIVDATEAWARDHHRAEMQWGFVPLEECCQALNRAMRSVRAGMVEVSTASLAGARVKAKAAGRALVETGDDPEDLVTLVRGYVDEHDADDPATLAWSVVGDILAAAGNFR